MSRAYDLFCWALALFVIGGFLLVFGLAAFASITNDSCSTAHADYIARATATEQCKSTVGCLLTTEDLLALNRAEAGVIANCPVEEKK